MASVCFLITGVMGTIFILVGFVDAPFSKSFSDFVENLNFLKNVPAEFLILFGICLFASVMIFAMQCLKMQMFKDKLWEKKELGGDYESDF